MGNRIICESIRTSLEISQMDFFEQVCFTSLIVTVDDYGRYYAEPLLLRNILFPMRNDVTTEAIEKAIQHMAELDLIRIYAVKERTYLQLTTWAKHQTIRNQKSKFPGPEDQNETTVENNCIQLNAIACKCSRNPNPIQTESVSESSFDSESVMPDAYSIETDEMENGENEEKEEEEDGELTEIDRDRQEVLAAWKDAGFPASTMTLNKVVELFSLHGKDRLLDAINKTVEANARSPFRYLSAVLDPGHRPMRPINPMSAANFRQREYSDDTDDMDRMMAGA